MNTFTTHLWHDPFLTRCVVAIGHLLEGFPMSSHAEIVATCLRRYGSRPVYFRSFHGEWLHLIHDGAAFTEARPPDSARTLAKLALDFPLPIDNLAAGPSVAVLMPPTGGGDALRQKYDGKPGWLLVGVPARTDFFFSDTIVTGGFTHEPDTRTEQQRAMDRADDIGGAP